MPRPNHLLRLSMKTLIIFVQDEWRRTMTMEGDTHLTLCHATADKFDLWEPERGMSSGEGCHFPIWLSRVVEGVIQDMEANDLTI